MPGVGVRVGALLPLNKMAKEIKCFLQNKMHRNLQGCKHPSLGGVWGVARKNRGEVG